jgi:hypothetical protein
MRKDISSLFTKKNNIDKEERRRKKLLMVDSWPYAFPHDNHFEVTLIGLAVVENAFKKRRLPEAAFSNKKNSPPKKFILTETHFSLAFLRGLVKGLR